MTMQFRALADQAAADGAITAEEVLSLRRIAWPDGVIDPAEAEAILVLNDHAVGKTTEWADFLCESIGEFVVNGREPKGYVDEATADWLIGRLDHDGRLESVTELELVVRVLEKALNAPERLKRYVLDHIERAVLTGEGPTRDGGALEPGCISDGECRLLRRVIFASGGDGPARVSQAEAEMLFRLKDATLNAANAPEWERLFVQGVGNYLQGWQGSAPLSRERAGELESFMDDRASHVGRFFGRMARVNTNGFASAVRAVTFGRKGTHRDITGEAHAAQEVTGAESLWLNAQIDADNKVDALEEALLKFLGEG